MISDMKRAKVRTILQPTSWQAGAFGHLPESDITDLQVTDFRNA
jgi:hypothetical protein